jgi:glycosyltransferase involved in cell wall biosynthesis
VVAVRRPPGKGAWRKLSLLLGLPYYLGTVVRHVRRADVAYIPLPGDIPFLGLLVALMSRKRMISYWVASWAQTARTRYTDRVVLRILRRFAGGRNVALVVGVGPEPPASRMNWLFATALSQSEIDRTTAVLTRGLSKPPVAVFAGRLTPVKGVKYLFEALASLTRMGFQPIPRVLVAGDGEERAALEDAARVLRCEEHVTFLGQLDRRALSSVFSQADFSVQPSLSEGFCKAWVDAMAHGLPVLTSEVGAARAVIGEPGKRGWLVPPGDADALAEAMKAVIGDSVDWPSIRRRCRVYAEEFTLENWAGRIGQICAHQWGISLVEGKLRP